jgi:hypothetical protein
MTAPNSLMPSAPSDCTPPRESPVSVPPDKSLEHGLLLKETRALINWRTNYKAACRSIEACARTDERKEVVNVSVAMREYAKQAKNHDLEAQCIEIRMRATRRLDELRQAQKKTVGLARGGEHGGRRRKDGLRHNPSNARALRRTLARKSWPPPTRIALTRKSRTSGLPCRVHVAPTFSHPS